MRIPSSQPDIGVKGMNSQTFSKFGLTKNGDSRRLKQRKLGRKKKS